MSTSIEIFLSYAHEDEKLCKELEKHLSILERQGIINIWHDRNINAGSEWKHEIDAHLNAAQIILLLVSPDFMVSDYCYSVEMKRAMERHERGEARVIPVILREVDWKETLFGKLRALPRNTKPVTDPSWYSPGSHIPDRAFREITAGIRTVVEAFSKQQPSEDGSPSSSPSSSPHLPHPNKSNRIIGFLALAISVVLICAVVFTVFAPTLFSLFLAPNSPQALYDQATNGSPFLDDPLNSQNANNWQGQTNNCVFTEGAYHIYATNAVTECYAQTTNFSNMAFQVQMTILHGDGGGLIFGYNGQNSMEYRFNVRSDGLYDLSYGNTPVLYHATSHGINFGLNQNNLLTVIVKEQIVYFYINKQFVAQASILNGTTASGSIGLFVSSAGLLTEVIFSNVKVWKL